jgi:hypothetical protein
MAVILPDDSYGDLVAQVINSNDVIRISKVLTLSKDTNIQDAIQDFSGYNVRKELLDKDVSFYESLLKEEEALKVKISNRKELSDEEFFTAYARLNDLKSIKEPVLSKLEELKQKTTGGDLDFDCVLIGFGGDKLREIASLLAYYDVSPSKVQYLGTGLFDDKHLNDESSLVGAWYSSPYSTQLTKYQDKYADIFRATPIRISSIAYDAISLMAYFAFKEVVPKYKDLTNNQGFVGLDGFFKFNEQGIIERDLSIMQIRKKGDPKKIANAMDNIITE